MKKTVRNVSMAPNSSSNDNSNSSRNEAAQSFICGPREERAPPPPNCRWHSVLRVLLTFLPVFSPVTALHSFSVARNNIPGTVYLRRYDDAVM